MIRGFRAHLLKRSIVTKENIITLILKDFASQKVEVGLGADGTITAKKWQILSARD